MLIVSCTSEEPSNIATIKGTILSGKVEDVEFKNMLDNPITGKGKAWSAKVDSEANFTIEIPLQGIALGTIKTGRYTHEICLMPGDNMQLTIDGDSIVYSGKGAGKNNYLYATEKKGLTERGFYSRPKKGNPTLEEFYKKASNQKQKRMDFIDAYSANNDVDDAFVKYYKLYTQGLLDKVLMSYPRRYASANKYSLDSLDIPEAYKRTSLLLANQNDACCISHQYVRNMSDRLYAEARDVYKSKQNVEFDDVYYSLLNDSLSGLTKEYVKCKKVIGRLAFNSYDSTSVEQLKSEITDPLAIETLNSALDKYFAKQALINKPLHQEFAETLLIDTCGNEITFSELMNGFKGKVVYVDFWGWGCGPCIAAMPYAKELKTQLAEVPVEFVYLSVTSFNKKTWKRAFEVTSTKKNQYAFKKGFDNRLYQFMGVNWVPYYLMFDKEGSLVNLQAGRPSKNGNVKLEKELRDLANK